MTKIIEASNVTIANCSVLFDTNIWLMLEGFDLQAPRSKVAVYGDAYKALIKGRNHIVINDYVLGEFCNRAGKLIFEQMKDQDPALKEYSYKTFRRRRKLDFLPKLEEIRLSCLQILDNCDFIHTSDYGLDAILDIFSAGTLDFSDIVIAKFCVNEKCFLMSDDKDFTRHNFDLTLITHFNS